MKISASIITHNEEKNIGNCIDSLGQVADEIVVLDSFSSDATKDLAIEKGAQVIQKNFIGFTAQKQLAIEYCSHDFILSLDADERLSDELIQSIQKIKRLKNAHVFSCNRLNHFNRKPIKSCGWYPDKKIRLFHKKFANWQGGLVHEEVIPFNAEEKIIHLKGDLLHFGFNTVGDLLNKMQKYAAIYARENAHQRNITPWEIKLKTKAAFFKNYFIKKGIFDGYIGYLISKANADGVHYKYAMLRETNQSLACSLIITTYNRPEALKRVINSVFLQSKAPKEIIIADDGSNEKTKNMLATFNHRKIPIVHIWQEDKGFRAAKIRNKAIARAKEKYIVLIDGDMVLPQHFIADHLYCAQKKRIVQGSRVLLDEKTSFETIKEKAKPNFFTKNIRNRKNTIRSSFLSKVFSYSNQNIFKVRSANLSFWKSDALAINGFNEDFQGWGREDSEFIQRLFHRGIKKFHPKFKASAYHLHHKENSRAQLPENEALLQKSIDEKLLECSNGINKYLP